MPSPEPNSDPEPMPEHVPPKAGYQGRPNAIAALQIPAFRLFLFGSVLSSAGSQMRTLAIGWEVYGITKEPLSLGLIGLVLSLPVLLLAMPAGVAADRFSRKKILLIAHSGLALSALGLAWASAEQIPLIWIYLLLLVTGSCRALGWPSHVALVTQLVPRHLFSNAATWRSMAFQLSATLGPLLGGILLALYRPMWIYLIDAATSAILVLCLLRIQPGPQSRNSRLKSWDGLLEGMRFVRRQPLILSTITLDMVAVLFGGATALLPVYAQDVLDVGATGFGWLRAMPSIGAMLMALTLATLAPIRRAGHAMLGAVAVFGGATIVFGMSTSFPLSLAALLVMGAADNISVVVRATLVQLLTPDAMRGRVSAINAIFINTSNEIGEFESGVTAQWFGPVLAVAGGGVMTLVTVAVVAAKWPVLRTLGRLEDIRPRALEPDEGGVEAAETPVGVASAAGEGAKVAAAEAV
jgi:MFS family permease